jgi:hypothetical protein
MLPHKPCTRVEIRACGRNRQRFVVTPAFRRCIEPWGTIGIIIKASHYKSPLRRPHQVSRKRGKFRVFSVQLLYRYLWQSAGVGSLERNSRCRKASRSLYCCIVGRISLWEIAQWVLLQVSSCPSQDHRTVRIRLLASTKWRRRPPLPSYIAARPAGMIPVAHSNALPFRQSLLHRAMLICNSHLIFRRPRTSRRRKQDLR